MKERIGSHAKFRWNVQITLKKGHGWEKPCPFWGSIAEQQIIAALLKGTIELIQKRLVIFLP